MPDPRRPLSEPPRLALWVDAVLLVASAAALRWLSPAAPRGGWIPGFRDALGAAVLLAGGHLLLVLARTVRNRHRRRAG